MGAQQQGTVDADPVVVRCVRLRIMMAVTGADMAYNAVEQHRQTHWENFFFLCMLCTKLRNAKVRNLTPHAKRPHGMNRACCSCHGMEGTGPFDFVACFLVAMGCCCGAMTFVAHPFPFLVGSEAASCLVGHGCSKPTCADGSKGSKRGARGAGGRNKMHLFFVPFTLA
jgi:hypothetical protein